MPASLAVQGARFEGLEPRIAASELEILKRLRVAERLSNAVGSAEGLAAFARAFYFCRVEFVRLNFLLGSRCAENERHWGPIARNLWEEHGGGETKPHNALYRDFLRMATLQDERELVEPAFAMKFNQDWIDFIQNRAVEQCLFAFAVYEALDVPDYRLLYETTLGALGDRSELFFFKVHTGVRHVDLFADFLEDTSISDQAANEATNFVLVAQEAMWKGLLDHLRV